MENIMDGYNEWMNRALALEAQNELLKKEIEILSKSNFDMIKEFHAAFSKVPDPERPTIPDFDTIMLRYKLMYEELTEVMRELGVTMPSFQYDLFMPEEIQLHKVAKELADLLYVVYGTAAALGIDIDAVYERVHQSNMSKLGPDGKPIYREDGKVLKGPNYVEPDIRSIIG